MNKPSLSAITDTAVKIVTALVIVKFLYVHWAFNWNIFSTPWLCVEKILLLIFFTSLALQTHRIYPQVLLGLSWILTFPRFSIFADRISFRDSSPENYLINIGLLLLSAPTMLNIIYRHSNDIEIIRRSARDFHTPRRDALLPFFCQIGLFIAFAAIIYPFGYRKPGFNIFLCLLFIAFLLPLPAALVRRLKARHAAVQSPLDTPQESQNNETAIADKPVRHLFWHKCQFYLRLAIIISCTTFIFCRSKSITAGILLICSICLIIGLIEEIILLYKLRKKPPLTQTPAAKHSADNSPAQTSKAPLLRMQQSQSQKQKNARAINALLQGLGIIILLILFVFLTLDVHYSSGGNINTYDRRF